MTKLLTLLIFTVISSHLIGQANFVDRKEKYLINQDLKMDSGRNG